jgi:Putative restriction endonuclease
MSTTDQEVQLATPPLVDGERLDRATFHERYAAMPESTRAELIGGVVYMASPLGLRHGISDPNASFWLGYYQAYTPGTEVLGNASVFFEDYGEHQPDAVLRILPENGGRTVDEGNYYTNGPELVVEVSDSTLRKDLGPKLADYERAGVPEYIVLGVDPPAVRWHLRVEGRLVEVGPDPDGIYRSKVFPGLWLDPIALLSGDNRRLMATVDLGLATADHAAFVARLAEAGGAGPG